MAHHTKIYGYINGATWETKDFFKLHRLNTEVISKLPDIDIEFPFINRSMFSISNEQGIFRDQIIAFGASYKTLEYEWHLWLMKFENILKMLFWTDVKIHAEFEVMGQYTYEWKIDLNERENWLQENPVPIINWTYKSNGPRTFTDVLKI